jgi:hypothetical protein
MALIVEETRVPWRCGIDRGLDDPALLERYPRAIRG